ncbi:MAG: prepilin-type N-terminal cleavage/methylation domain-containing protein [Planctomycetes bacterium]|nr:prepilin-type N-terminal cleavage/methylation domain-containing protein [Planctomycetota bacterium]
MSTNRNGFTLLEVLVSMFISALIMVSVLGSLDSTQKAVDAIHNITLVEKAGPQLVSMIRQDLSRLAVYDAGEYQVLLGESRTSPRGADADRINMLVHSRSANPYFDGVSNRQMRAPVNEVGYWVRQRPDSDDFLQLFRREDFMVDSEPFQDGYFAPLNDRIISFDLVYYREPEFDPNSEDNWDTMQEGQLPYCIELNLELEVQPRKSAESKQILGANYARLEFSDFLVIPESTRWNFRNRIYPTLAGASGGAAGTEGTGQQGDAQSQIQDIQGSSGVSDR